MSRSVDGGRSFGANQVVGTGGAVLLASALTGTVHAFGLLPPGCPPVLTAPSPEAAALATRDRSTNSSCPSGNALTHSSSQDDGLTWSPAEVLRDPFVVGEGGLDHGIELQHGPHRGRLVLPYSEASQSKDKYAAHAMAVYSDNAGKNWSVGALLPDYSGEASITELANGSLLISFRSEGEHMTRHPHNRGFARSDTGE
jgi:sialidase-1